MLGRCSSMTLYHRFHGITDGVAYARHVLANADGHDSYLAWSEDRCVGVGSLHVGEDQAEIGVLVEDSWQRRGVGTALLAALVGRARRCDLSSLRADVLGGKFLHPSGIEPRRPDQDLIDDWQLHGAGRPPSRLDIRPEPVRPEPVRPEPVRPQPVRPEPVRPVPL